MVSVGSSLKRTAEGILARPRILSLGRRMRRWRGLILAYHNVVPDGEPERGDPSLHLPLGRFGEQMEILRESYAVVTLEELLRISGGEIRREDRSERPRVAITFDDGYRGALLLGVPELVRRGLPATVFVAPALLGDRTLWWDLFGSALRSERGSAFRRAALEEHRGEVEAVREWARSEGWREEDPGPYRRTATADELRWACDQPGIDVGSHSWSHPNLARLANGEVRTELERSFRWLADRFPDVIPWLAYPYGLFGPGTERAATELGYRAALRVNGGWLPRRPERVYSLPRLSVPAGLSLDGFRLRLAGIWGG